MRRIILFLQALVFAACAHAQVIGPKITIPGTGVALVAPPGFAVATVGPTLIDASGETFINFLMSDVKYSLEGDATWRAIFPKAPERVKTPTLAGNLYERTRAENGGKWDGWMLAVSRGTNVLTVVAMYTGDSPDSFHRLRDYLLTVAWNDSVAAPDVAVGVSLIPPYGLRVVNGAFGALLFNESGKPGGGGVSLMIQGMPVPASKSQDIFPGGCEQVIAGGFGGKRFTGPRLAKGVEAEFCAGWSNSDDPNPHYIALIKLKSGGLLSVIGSAPRARFEESILNFQSSIAGLKSISR